jgi:hypothetical protein
MPTALQSTPVKQYEIVEGKGFRCYGAGERLWSYQGPEVILHGPYETGKTISALFKVHTFLSMFPGAQGLMVRKSYKTLLSSACVTYELKVLPYPPGDRL